MTKRLFLGIKISNALQAELDNPAAGAREYFEATASEDCLQIINLGERKFIGRYMEDGFPVAEIGEVSRTLCNMLKTITRGRRIEEGDVQIYCS
jgi:hypothetical protein